MRATCCLRAALLVGLVARDRARRLCRGGRGGPLAAVPGRGSDRGLARGRGPRGLVAHGTRGLDGGDPGPRLVVARGLGRHGVRDLGGQPRGRSRSPPRASTATTTSPSCRPRGCPTTRSCGGCAPATTRPPRKRATTCGGWSTASTRPRAGCAGRPRSTGASPSAGATARTPTPRRRRPPTASGSTWPWATSASSPTRWTASRCGPGAPSRARPISTSAPHPRRWCTTGRVYVLNDNMEASFLAALDAQIGARALAHPARLQEVAWCSRASPRPSSGRTSGRTEIVTLAPQAVVSYDLEGRELWRFTGTSMVAAPTPVAEGDLLFVGSGSPSENVRPLVAIRAGAKGDISLKGNDQRNEWVAWYQERGGPYITSPLVYGSRVYVLFDQGFFGAYDAATRQAALQGPLPGGHAHLLRLALGPRRQDLLPERGRRDLGGGGGRHLQGRGSQPHGRDEPRHPRPGPRQPVPAHEHPALPHSLLSRPAGGRGPAPGC